jgi:pilus assembly protein CpaF
LIWYAIFTAGIFATVFAASYVLIFKIGKTGWLAEIKKMQKLQEIGLSDSLQRWVVQAEKGMNKTGIIGGHGWKVLVGSLPISIVGFWFGVMHFHNLVAAILLAVIGVILPEQIVYTREKAYRGKVMEQLGTAVRMFAAEYAETPNTVRALIIIAPQLPDHIGTIFRQTTRDFSVGRDTNDALIRLSQKLNFEYGKLFVQLLRLSIEDSAVSPMFTRLALRLSSQQRLIRKSTSEVSMDRMLAIVLNIAIVPAYIIINRVMPDSYVFFVNTAMGRIIIVLCLASVIVGVLMDRLIDRGGELA